MGWFADGAWSSPATSQKARKAHHCDRCLGTIRPGSAYLRWCSVDDGRATTVRSHRLCDRLDIGEGDYYEIDPDFGHEEWCERLARFAPESWFDEWGNCFVWPPVFHDELRALLGGAS